ncbi:hypothetical protein B0H63DRAFT_449443 [Podospora didyma]|uniref:SWR1-complex protein 3 domain-containing protein n=1 Tax=Podospora didyma TaxID=330526 RepID=A0AAE0TZL2_9PEZI|nr:hypothetical protein B0H63DRAFT_449443 [Podospora didyma]
MTPPTRNKAQSLAAAPPPPPEPEPEPEPEPIEEPPPPPPPLPRSVTAGKPLPIVDTPQPENLPNKDYQSVQESGVLAESLARSRAQWIREGIFEKYWSKPTKRKGAVTEDPNNPPKDSMVKLGQVTITVEPHVFEAIMYGVKDSKPAPPAPSPATRPFQPKLLHQLQRQLQHRLQHRLKLKPQCNLPRELQVNKHHILSRHHRLQFNTRIHNLPTSRLLYTTTPIAFQPMPHSPYHHSMPAPNASTTPTYTTPNYSSPNYAPPNYASPNYPPPNYSPSYPSPSYVAPNYVSPAVPPRPVAAPMMPPPSPHSVSTPPAVAVPQKPAQQTPTQTTPTQPTAAQPQTADPIILGLADRATDDAPLRDIMKRVASGEATKEELIYFQSIIDGITQENAQSKTGEAAPSADTLMVDGRSVRYFADEVRVILEIVLRSNPKQTSANLRPPVGSDPLIVMLVKSALDNSRIKNIIQRIAGNTPNFTDAKELQAALEFLLSKAKLAKAKELQQTQSPVSATSPAAAKASGASSAGPAASSPVVALSATHQQQQQQQQQQQHSMPPPPAPPSLRSRGPPPAPVLDLSAVVFEFSGGTGDRYLFPKFSVVENVPVATGHQVIASFFIVRKGSQSEYPMADPELDYYQPLTIRLFAQTGRHLDYLSKVVAPQADVARYMDDIMDNMTRAEYVLIAMRLPRGEGAGKDLEAGSDEKEKEKEKEKEMEQTSGVKGPKQGDVEPNVQNPPPQPGVLWTTTTTKLQRPEIRELPPRSRMYSSKALDNDDQYQSFISTVSRKEPREL